MLCIGLLCYDGILCCVMLRHIMLHSIMAESTHRLDAGEELAVGQGGSSWPRTAGE